MSDQALRRPERKGRSRDPVRDSLIVLCITVVALAMGSGLHLQFAMTFWLAVAAALAAFVVLLSTHVLLRRSDYVDDLRREVARLEARLGRPSAPPTRQPAAAPQGAAAPELSPAALVLPPRREPAPAGPVATMEEYWGFAPTTGIAAPASAPAVPAVDAITEAIAKLPAAETPSCPPETSMLPDAEALAPPPVASTPHAEARIRATPMPTRSTR